MVLHIFLPFLIVSKVKTKLVFNDIAATLNPGVNYMKLNLQSIKAGHYNLVLETNSHKATKSLIKVQ